MENTGPKFIEVEGPDGLVFEFPKGMDRGEITRATAHDPPGSCPNPAAPAGYDP